MNKLFFIVFIVGALFSSAACSNRDRAGNGHGHGATADPSLAEQHGREEENIVTLSKAQQQTVGIAIGTVEAKPLSAAMKANGFLRVPNNNKANATSLFGGIVKTLDVEIGDEVKKGQAIATIANPQFVQLQEEYLRINSDIAFAEQELARQVELRAGDVGARKNLQRATADRNALKTRKASLHEQIQLMGINPASLSDTSLQSSLTVRSPINGVVSDVFAKIGSYVDVSSPIAELVENSALHLDLQVFEKDIPLIKAGQRIDFVVTNSPNKTYAAEVYNVGSSFNSDSRTIAVHSRVIGDKTGLIDGMNITGIVDLDSATGPAVPNDAVVHADGKYYVFLVKDDDEQGTRFERMEVIKGTTELGYTAITPMRDTPIGTSIVVKNAFFVNAEMDSEGGNHAH